MFEERYKRVTEGIHADEDLIERTLDAAETPPAKAIPWHRGFLLAAGAVCAFVLIVIAVAHLMPPPKDVVASNGETPGNSEEFLPLPSKLPSDDLSLSVSDVQLVSDTELSFILTVRGDKVDRLTTIDWNFDYDYALPYLYGTELHGLQEYEGQPSNELRFQLTLESRERHILDAFEPTLNLEISRYTIGNQEIETVYEVDWNTVDFNLQEGGEPIIDLGNGLSVSGFGFSEEGLLIVQCRWPFTSMEPTFMMTWLSPDSTNPDQSNIYMQRSKQYGSGDYICSDYTFPVTREDLDGIDLGILAVMAGEEIRGSWPITIDLSHLTAE